MAEQEGKKTTLYYKIDDFCKFCRPFVSELIRSSQFYGKEKHNAKILSIYLSELDEKSQNYSSIKVYVKWSLGEFERFIA